MLGANKDKLLPVLFLIFLLGVWEGLIRLLEVPPFVLPGPINVLKELYYGLASGVFLYHTWITFLEMVLGFLLGSLGGFVLGVLISQVKLIERIFYPYVVALQTLPKIAIAPLFVIWFGFGITSKIVVTALVSLFPVMVNVIVGLKSVDANQLDLMKSLCASKWQVFRMCKFPASLPLLFAGLQIGIVFSVIGAIVGEFVGAEAGLGYLITLLNFKLQVAAVFAVLIILSFIGIILHSIVRIISNRIIFWVGGDEHRIIGA